MDQLTDGVCVVTGAGSGIGCALADAFGAEGMHVVVVDVVPDRVAAAVSELAGRGVDCAGEVVDVRDGAAVEQLAARTVERFGRVDVVCNNAGVFAMGRQWELSLDTWEQVLDVCFWGVVHGVRSFVPHMLAGGRPGHVVNTASVSGLVRGPYAGPYTSAKHAVVGLSKGLRVELADTPIGVSVVCPGSVVTSIGGSLPGATAADGDELEAMRAELGSGLTAGIDPSAAAALVVDAVQRNRFWVLPNATPFLQRAQEDFEELLATDARS
jgi:NAD(P)-dependent dehydrogenase (short-subunit alcohol dehydrogenase family)